MARIASMQSLEMPKAAAAAAAADAHSLYIMNAVSLVRSQR